jgi:hypothetical protein
MANNGDEMLGSIDTSVLPFVDSLTLYFDAFFEHFDLSRFSVWKVNQYTHDCIEDCYELLLHAVHTGCESQENFLSSVRKVFDLDCWKRIVHICDKFSIEVSCPTPLSVGTANWLKGLDESEISTLCQDVNWIQLIKDSFEYLGDFWSETNFGHVETRQRSVNRMIQALQMSSEVSASDESYKNPFSQWSFNGLLLSPILQPGTSRRNMGELIQHCCLPNTALRCRIKQPCNTFAISLYATRDIMDGEPMSFAFSSEPPCGHCLRCVSNGDLRRLFSSELICGFIAHYPEPVAKTLRTLFALSSSHKRFRQLSDIQDKSPSTIPRWQTELRRLAQHLSATPSTTNSMDCDLIVWSKWRALADFWASDSMQSESVVTGVHLSGCIAIYCTLLLTIQDSSEQSFLNLKAQIALSLVAVIMEMFTLKAQDHIGSQALSLRFGSNREELQLLRHIIAIGLSYQEALNTPCEAVASLRVLLRKQTCFEQLYQIPIHELVNSSSMQGCKVVEVDSSENLRVAVGGQIFTKEECQNIILEAENFAAQSIDGWTTSRHYSVPTTDLPSTVLSEEIQLLVMDRMSKNLLPFMWKTFTDQKMSPTSDSIGALAFDIFVVKYDASGSINSDAFAPYAGHKSIASRQRFLPLHRDQSAHSAVIALNSPASDFTGGGTYIPAMKMLDGLSTLSPETGQAACFSGNLLHGGDAVLSGCRYIIAAFFVLYEVGNFEDEIDIDIPEQNEEDAAVRKKFKIDIDQPNEFSFGFLL